MDREIFNFKNLKKKNNIKKKILVPTLISVDHCQFFFTTDIVGFISGLSVCDSVYCLVLTVTLHSAIVLRVRYFIG